MEQRQGFQWAEPCPKPLSLKNENIHTCVFESCCGHLGIFCSSRHSLSPRRYRVGRGPEGDVVQRCRQWKIRRGGFAVPVETMGLPRILRMALALALALVTRRCLALDGARARTRARATLLELAVLPSVAGALLVLPVSVARRPFGTETEGGKGRARGSQGGGRGGGSSCRGVHLADCLAGSGASTLLRGSRHIRQSQRLWSWFTPHSSQEASRRERGAD